MFIGQYNTLSFIANQQLFGQPRSTSALLLYTPLLPNSAFILNVS